MLPPSAGAAPQLEIADANLELVAEIADRKLRIYLDRPATNAPIDGAAIQVTADGIPAGTATAKADGTYELPTPWADEPGTRKLKFAVTASVVLQPGISLAESNRIGRLAEEIVAQVPEVRSVGRRTGRAELDEHAEGVHNSELDVDLRPSGRSREAVLADIRGRLAALPASITVGQPIAHRLDHMLSGVRAQIAMKIYGDDYDTLRGPAADFETRLKRIPGVVDLQTEKQVRIPQMQVRVDYAKAALYDLNPNKVTEALEALSNGQVVSQIVDGQKRFDVVVRLSDADRSTRALGDMLIESPAGRIPLGTVLTIAMPAFAGSGNCGRQTAAFLP